MTTYNPDAYTSTSCPQDGSVLSDENGAISIASGASSFSGSFLTQKGTELDYVFEAAYIENTTDANPLIIGWEITGKTVNGFTVTLDSITDTANYVFRYRVRAI